jgi:hypothetical protein
MIIDKLRQVFEKRKSEPLAETPTRLQMDEYIKGILSEEVTDDEMHQLYEVQKTMTSPGWGFIVQMLDKQREALIRQAEKVDEDGGPEGWRALQGALRGFRLAVEIPAKLYRRAMEISDKEQKNDERENA